ncbi:hypothetical protein [Streptomyces sennicomposti]|uniref:hypothetical protein n=1 Tax=Streptomyces sennicomposti TaxID=2873384 RepID=UPI001CA6077A|nr:hypothetical protein [Streptomyces sennicomposti]MBY8868737.1 hypothetical protein [Streptomyces sennicomposti]
MKAAENFTAERITALVAILAGTLGALLAVHVGAGIGNTIGAAFLTYVATIVVVAIKVPLQLGKVVTASGRGTMIAVVVTAIVLFGIARAFRGLA